MTKYTFDRRHAARHVNGSIVTVPDQVAADQRAFDGRSFVVLGHDYYGAYRRRCYLRGDLYGLHTSGTGDMVVASRPARS